MPKVQEKIYLTRIGPIIKEDGWRSITKPENFRCPKFVLDVINKIHAEEDGLEQTRGRLIKRAEGEVSVPGTARLFVVPADATRAQRVPQIRQWLAEKNGDQLWLDDSAQGGLKVMVLVHRMAAERLGFPDLYAALNDNGATSLKEGLLDGHGLGPAAFQAICPPSRQGFNGW